MKKDNISFKEVTIIYYQDNALELLQSVETFPQHDGGRVEISAEFKQGKSIVAVCEGSVDMLNQFGDRLEFTYSS